MCNKKSNEKSPGKVVSELMKHGNKKVIRRKLLFGEALKCQLTQHFKLLSSRQKKSLVNFWLGIKIFKKNITYCVICVVQFQPRYSTVHVY